MKIIVVIACGLFCLAVVHWRAHQRETQAIAAFPAQGVLLDVDGVTVHARVMGEGPDLVLLHGASGNLRDFTYALAPALADRYRVVMFDRPGLGWTGRVPGTASGAWGRRAESPRAQARLLQKAAAQLDVDRPIVLGHSFGGAVAWAWGLEAPAETAAIVSVAGVAMPWPGKLAWLTRATGSTWGGALLVPLITAFAPERVVNASVGSIFEPHPVPEGYVAHIGPMLTLRRDTFRANARQVNGLRPHIVEMSRDYPGLPMPVEIVHGDADVTVPLAIHSAPLPGIMPQANLTVLPGAAHMPQHSHMADVIAAIDRAAARAGLR